ncbi:MAG: hypothetical protein ABF453_07775, partial [Bifidobacterium psychraerophilum]|uniref:hypothetical protein n=1 Tax=Bifidobacterium psychraerophilum TaxID=218140 RepID=UPI0039E9A21B
PTISTPTTPTTPTTICLGVFDTLSAVSAWVSQRLACRLLSTNYLVLMKPEPQKGSAGDGLVLS